MCIKRNACALLLLGAGLGLMLSFLVGGWFWRLLIAVGLLILSAVLLK